MAIDPLSIGWAHAYWAEGPEFTALGLADGAQVSSWPDEIGTSNLAQATAADRPLYRATRADFCNKPVIDFVDDGDRMDVTWSSLAQPNEVVLIARKKSVQSGVETHTRVWMDSPSGNRHYLQSDQTTYSMFAGGSFVSGGTPDNELHFFDMLFDGASSFLAIDSVQVGTGNPGSQAMAGLRVSLNQASSTVQNPNLDVAFIGVKDTALTSQERADLYAWFLEHYVCLGKLVVGWMTLN